MVHSAAEWKWRRPINPKRIFSTWIMDSVYLLSSWPVSLLCLHNQILSLGNLIRQSLNYWVWSVTDCLSKGIFCRWKYWLFLPEKFRVPHLLEGAWRIWEWDSCQRDAGCFSCKRSKEAEGENGWYINISQTVLVMGSPANFPLQQLVALPVLPASYFLMAKFWAWGSRIDSYRIKS